MLARLPRPLAVLFALAFAAALVWCFAAPRQAIVSGPVGGYTDVQLYSDIVARMGGGEGYYAAATAQQRAHEYPTRPFVTVRLPTLYWLASELGWQSLDFAKTALLLLNGLIWPFALPGRLSWFERVAAGVAIVIGGLADASPAITSMTETWTGLLIGLAAAAATWRRDQWWLPVLLMAAALAFRELALGFVLVAALMAYLEGQRRQLIAWLGLIAVFGAALMFHAQAVAAHALPSDLASPGWSAGMGLRGLLQALVGTSLLQHIDRGPALAIALLPVLGWLALEWRGGALILLTLGGYAAGIALFPRPDNFYWGFLLLPLWFAGIALAPRALWQLGGAISRR